MQEEAIKRAIDTAYRARGFAEKLQRDGYIRRGGILREGRERILSLEEEKNPGFVFKTIFEKTEGFSRGMEKANYHPGGRKDYSLKDKREPMGNIYAIKPNYNRKGQG